MRTAGILMPISSLPSPYGIGTLGADARNFIEFLHKSGQKYWQILPICPTGYGDSPYQSFSSFAGNPYLIDLDELTADGLLTKNDYDSIHWSDTPERINYGLLYNERFHVLRTACTNAQTKLSEECHAFEKKQSFWLEDYALYMAIKNAHHGASWQEWPDSLRFRDPQALSKVRIELNDEILFWKTVQFLFFRQWQKIKAFATDYGIKIIGDLPIYVSGDSADVWSDPKQFQLNESLKPIEISGCPPDAFAEDGQLWGNPLFDWDYMKKDQFRWWIRRISYQMDIYDVLRIDHFRGFDEYFAIPYGDTTARNGQWKKGPGIRFFQAVREALGDLPIIAEDLGFLTESVRELLHETGFPGMKVLEFAFDSRDTGYGYIPHEYPKNCIVYTGTHDNETILGWFQTAPEEDTQKAIRYLRLTKEEGYNWGMMRCAWASVGHTAIMQMQDLLDLGTEGRMNTPSTLGNNWTWRCLPEDINDTLAKKIYADMCLYDRLPK